MDDTKKLSYKQILESLNELQTIVFQAITSFHYPVCDRQIAEYTDLDINVVTARRYELAKLGMIGFSHVGKSPYTRRKVKFWW